MGVGLDSEERERSDLENGAFTKASTYVDYGCSYLSNAVPTMRQSRRTAISRVCKAYKELELQRKRGFRV